MAVHTLGNTIPPSYGANDTSQYNEIGPTGWVVMPADGYVTLLAGYFGSTSGGAMNSALLLFNNSGILQGGSGGFNVAGQAWQTHSYGPAYYAAGTALGVGWWVGAEVHFSVYGSGHWQAENVGSPSNLNGFEPGGSYFQGGTGYYLEWIDPLSVSSVSPGSGHVGDSVTIGGAGFVGGAVTGVTFNGVSASYSVTDDGHISATVPAGATSGNIVVSSDHGSGSIAFTVLTSCSIFDSAAWQPAVEVYAGDSAAWQPAVEVYVYDSTAWQLSS